MSYSKKRYIITLIGSVIILLFSGVALASETTAAHGGDDIGAELPIWSALPFVGILLSIALFPLLKPVFWHHHFGKVSAFWALVFAIPFLIFFTGEALYAILHITIVDYIPFILLLWGLFTVSGGIHLRGTLMGTPTVNVTFLLIGTILASLIGTTGASMLLIRPVIRANRNRKNKMHVIIFFIFLVSNIGGSLTPLGDPPLFLGFLHGVPFFWTLHLFPLMGLLSLLLLALLFMVDTVMYKKEGSPRLESETVEPFKVEGLHNFIYLGGIMGAVLMSGLWHLGEVNLLGVHVSWQDLLRDLLIILMGLLSLKTTSLQLRRDNAFTWFPIQEVAILFAGIFITIIPALAMLRAGEHGALAFLVTTVKEPWHYFWMTGVLSSFLDNAPTYLTFFNLALGRLGLTEPQATAILKGIVQNGVGQQFISILLAISAGAVFMGANSYIGNAPNFMVRSIAEENKIQMPSFFGFMAWSAGILIPSFLIITWVFF